MHEHTFIQAIINQVPNKEQVLSVTLAVGDLVGIAPDHLKEHLEEQTGWNVTVNKVPSAVHCSCGYTGEAKIVQRLHDLVLFACPSCGGNVEVLKGQDILIEKVTYNDQPFEHHA